MSANPNLNPNEKPNPLLQPPGKAKKPPKTEKESPEALAKKLFERLQKYIEKNGGRYLKDEQGVPFVVIREKRISLLPGPMNFDLKELILAACNVTSGLRSAQAAIERLLVHAHSEAPKLKLRYFSAVSEHHNRLYVPISEGKLLSIDSSGVTQVENGSFDHRLWLEHPEGAAFAYAPGESAEGLALFESLLVDTQACPSEAMRWFVAMNEGLFPYIRDLCPARMLTVHQGPTQQGKTSGAQRFTLLQGLGPVKGDFSIAALGNMPDCGLLVLDNKEHINLKQDLIDFLLAASTGAQRGRSTVDGQIRVSNAGRPVVVVTSIEGFFKAELQSRSVEVSYEIKGKGRSRADIEEQIVANCSKILSALMEVFVRFFQRDHEPCPNPKPNFEEHFRCLCNLLRAYGEVANKPEGWAEEIIQAWDAYLSAPVESEDELEQPLRAILEKPESETGVACKSFVHEGQAGTLFTCGASELLGLLKKEIKNGSTLWNLPKTASGLSRRLQSCKFDVLVLLRGDDYPEEPGLKRRKSRRPLGLWLPDDDGDDAE